MRIVIILVYILMYGNAFAQLDPGDTVYFERGSTFPETLTITDDGTSGNFITFTDYGSGALPIIDGEDTRANVSFNGKDYIVFENIHFKDSTGNAIPTWGNHHLIIDGCSITGAAAVGLGVFGGGNDIIIRNSTIDDSGGAGIFAEAKDDKDIYNLEIDECVITGNGTSGVYFLYGDPDTGEGGLVYTVDITDNLIDGNGAKGIRTYSNDGTNEMAYDIFIDDNTISNNDAAGIVLRDITNTSGENKISNNVVTENCVGDTPGGIYLAYVDAVIVERNLVYSNHTNGIDGRGISFDVGTQNSIMRYNHISDHVDRVTEGASDSAGIAIIGSAAYPNQNNEIGYNISYNNQYGFHVYGGDDDDIINLDLHNNIFSNNDSNGLDIRTVTDAGGITVTNNIVANNGSHGFYSGDVNELNDDYNCVYNNAVGNYDGVSAGASSIVAKPLFKDPTGGDFSLRKDLPYGIYIDGYDLDYRGRRIDKLRPTIGAFQFINPSIYSEEEEEL